MAEEKDDNQIELDVGDAEETEVELEVEQPEEILSRSPHPTKTIILRKRVMQRRSALIV